MGAGSRVVLAVFVDAFGWKVLSRGPFLDDVLRVKAPLRTLLGYSSTCDPTILTGKLPREHGHFSFYYYDPAHSPFRALAPLRWLPATISDRARFRRLVGAAFARWRGWRGYFQLYNVPFRYLPLFDYSEKNDIYQPGGIVGGVRTFLDDFRARGVLFFLSDWRQPEAENVRRLKAALEEGRIRFAYLILGGLDGVMHRWGPDHDATARKVREYDAWLRDVIATARRRYGDVRLHVFSDHGMTRVTGSSDLMKRVARTGLRFGVDFAAVYDSTMARFWFLRPAARERILEALAEEPRGRILTEQSLRAYGCDFEGHRYGETIFLMDPGIVIHPSFMGRTLLAGMHGYDPDHEDSVAAYASNGEAASPGGLTDLAGLLRREMVPDDIGSPESPDETARPTGPGSP